MLFAEGEFVDILELATDEDEIPTGPELEYIKNLYKAANDNVAAIDEIIKAFLIGYTIDRISQSDKVALRLGIAEMKYTETNAIVIIGEVVNIVKKYGTAKSAGFVNGILAKVNEVGACNL